jgi:soluble lytic murein transglycosylase-like protein
MYTESTGNKYAVSCKGYKGLMQIPHNVFYEDANLLIGARIFLEKMQQANHNMEKAVALYKGYPIESERGKQQVRKVMGLYYKLKQVDV